MGHEGSTRFRPKGSEGVNLNQRFYLGFSGNGKAAQHILELAHLGFSSGSGVENPPAVWETQEARV